jgi:hypothetical protein
MDILLANQEINQCSERLRGPLLDLCPGLWRSLLARCAVAGAHICRLGDRLFTGSAWAGYVGQRLWIEAFSVRPLERLRADQIEYKGVSSSGNETPWLTNGAICGAVAIEHLGFRGGFES